MIAPTFDALSEAGAHRLIGTIRAHWLQRGYAPQLWIEKGAASSGGFIAVKSNMVNGHPRLKDRITEAGV